MKKYPIEVEETRKIHRITFRQTIADALNAFNIERGLIYTVKLLVVGPRRIVDEYLYTGRFKIVNAFRLLILSTAACLFFIYLAGVDQFMMDFGIGFNSGLTNEELEKTTMVSELMVNLLFEWYNLFLWISIPIYAFFAFLFFERNYNYAEHLVIQTFYICSLNLITAVFFPIYLLTGYEIFAHLLFLISIAYFFYFTVKVFEVGRVSEGVKTLLLLIISNVVYFVVLGFVLVIFAGYELAKMDI